MRSLLIRVGIVALLVGCAYRPDPVPISGSATAVGNLAGTWLGEYNGTESQRSGSITFIISASGDSAFGDVAMAVGTNNTALLPAHSEAEHLRHVRSSQALRIDFVSVSGGGLSGTLEPYIAPDCNCRVSTTFSGRQNGNVIEGTFVTRGPNLEQHGTWRVSRNR
jgi:hypothetical protein